MSERIFSKAMPEPNSGCWLWVGALSSKGYGLMREGRKVRTVHRMVYESTVGPIEAGMCVCHRCDTPACVNPDHLFLGTNADNQADKVAKGRQARGEGNGRAKITADDVRAIRASSETRAQIARRYGLGWSTVNDIRKGRRWAAV